MRTSIQKVKFCFQRKANSWIQLSQWSNNFSWAWWGVNNIKAWLLNCLLFIFCFWERRSAREIIWDFLWLQSQSILQAVGSIPLSSLCDPSCPCRTATSVLKLGTCSGPEISQLQISLCFRKALKDQKATAYPSCKRQPRCDATLRKPVFKAEISTILSVLCS